MMKGDEKIILAAHRGDRKNYPENTMAAFRAAADFGVDMIETDLHMTADGELVIMHDRSALRTAGVDRNLDEMTLAEVKALDDGALFGPQFAGERVPTVREFLAFVRETPLTVNWELKDYPDLVGDAHAFAAADRLTELIEEYGMEDRSMLNSFSDRVLEHLVRRVGHRYPVHGQGIFRCRRTRDAAGIPEEELYDWCCMYPEEKSGNPVNYPASFAFCREHGILPCVCIADTRENYEKALALGCRMFTSNDIAAADAVLRDLGAR